MGANRVESRDPKESPSTQDICGNKEIRDETPTMRLKQKDEVRTSLCRRAAGGPSRGFEYGEP